MTLRIHPVTCLVIGLSIAFTYLRLTAGDDPHSYYAGWALGMLDCMALLMIKR